MRGLDLALAPGSATQVSVRETLLSDFFARLILSPAGEAQFAGCDEIAPRRPPKPTNTACQCSKQVGAGCS